MPIVEKALTTMKIHRRRFFYVQEGRPAGD